MQYDHLSQIISFQAKKYGDRTALCHRKELTDAWKSITWNSFEQSVISVSKAMLELGVSEHQRVAQFSQNMAENLIVDFALFRIRATMVPMYATSTAPQVEFIINDAEIELIFVGDQLQYDIACEVYNNSEFLKRIIVFDPDVVLTNLDVSMYYSDFLKIGKASDSQKEVENRMVNAVDTDLACILYTSGTTGNPKGVMLPHTCFKEALRVNEIQLSSLSDKDISLAFLPLSHVFERTWCYLCIQLGITVYVNYRPTEIQQAIKDVRPSLMCAVPRFWEKVYSGVNENISKFSPFMQGIVSWAVAVGRKYNIDTVRLGKKPGLYLQLQYKIADKLIFSKLKTAIGIENANIFPTAGAKLSDDITLFFRSIGVPIVYGYGLTESTATVSCFDYEGWKIGTVGKIVPNLEVKIGSENEILLKGKTIFPGYYKNPEATKSVFTDDGWFKTGDAGYVSGTELVMTERIKDLFKTSNGKYIAPQAIETSLELDKYIEQVAVIGDNRNYVTAIIAPSIPALEEYAIKIGISYETLDELLRKSEIIDFMTKRIAELQEGMSGYEKVKRFILIPKSFSIETGELTNTLKIRRAVIMQKYKSLIDEMYEN